MKSEDSIVSLKNITYIQKDQTILDSLNLDIEKDFFHFILGKNGSGKTTLLNLIYGKLWPTRGEVIVLGEKYGTFPIREVQKKIGILDRNHQENTLQKSLTVKQIIGSGFFSSIGLYNDFTEEQERELDRIISENSWIRDPNQTYRTLSDGEKKKILLLRALITEPELLLLDEPTSELDFSAREDFFETLSIQKKKRVFTCIMITHRADEIPEYFTRGILMRDGRVIQKGKIHECMKSKHLSEVYGIPIRVVKEFNRYFVFKECDNPENFQI